MAKYPETNMRTTEPFWIPVNEELPTVAEFGPYPTVLVAMVCAGHADWGYKVCTATLRFYGGDQTRPYWTNANIPHAPLENDAWVVRYWAPPISQPTGAAR